MTFLSGSLRLRLLCLILVPLLAVAVAAIYWRYDAARRTAEDIFDRNLIMLCMAVSRDVAHSGGDSLSVTTSNLFRDATGGSVFYHVYGPDGSFVTGYSSPPVRQDPAQLHHHTPLLFDALHRGQPVRAVSLAEPVIIGGISGVSVVTVWQQLDPRHSFARRLAVQAAITAALLVLTVAGVVIFGIRLGLRPLGRLEAAIHQRSSTDLRPIERQVPIEARGIVNRLNALFAQLTDAQNARDRLISNAAHQLRNPVAAIHAMAQATLAAKTLPDSQTRAQELVQETRRTVRLTHQMLSLERLRGQDPQLTRADICASIKDLTTRIAPNILGANIGLHVDLPTGPIWALFDQTLLHEAITNLIDNALQHGGDKLSEIQVAITTDPQWACITVQNDGTALPDVADAQDYFERFSPKGNTPGAGLGLSIVQEIAQMHGATLKISAKPMTAFSLCLPLNYSKALQKRL